MDNMLVGDGRYIADKVRNWLSQNGRTSMNLEKKSGVLRKTIDRIAGGETKATMENAIVLLASICEPAEAYEVLAMEYPEAAKAYPHKIDHVFRVDQEKNLHSVQGVRIFNLAACEGGVSRDQIRDEFGRNGLQILDKIIEDGVGVEKDGVVKASSFCTTPESGIKQIQALLETYEVENLGTSLATIALLCERLKHSAVVEAGEVLRYAVKQVAEIVTDPKNFGDIPMFFGFVANVLDHTKGEKL